MKKIIKAMVFLIVFSVVAPLTFSTSKSQETAISQIKKEYDKTIENEKNYKVQTVKIKESHKTTSHSVGDSIRYYTENEKLKKVISFQYTEVEGYSSRWINEYYVKNGKPYFIVETKIEEDNKKLEKPYVIRYYFSSDEKLIRVVEDGIVYDKIDNTLVEAGFSILEQFYEIRDLMRNLIREIDDEDRTTDYEEGEQKMSPEDITGEEVLLDGFNELKSLAGF